MAWSMLSRCLCHIFGVCTFMGGFGSLISGVIWLAFYGDDVSQLTTKEYTGIVLIVAGVIVIIWFAIYACFVKRRGWMLFACCEYDNMVLPSTLVKQPLKHQLHAEPRGGAAHQPTPAQVDAYRNRPPPPPPPPPIDYRLSTPTSIHGGTISVTEFFETGRQPSHGETLSVTEFYGEARQSSVDETLSLTDYYAAGRQSSHGGTISVTEFYKSARKSSRDEALERARAEIRMQVYNSANLYAIPIKGPSMLQSRADDMF